MNKLYYSLFVALLFVFSVTPAHANTLSDTSQNNNIQNEYHWDKLSINFGGFLTGLRNSLVLGSEELGLGVAIDLENALGLESSELVFRSDLEYIYGKRNRHTLRFGYLGFFRSSTKTIDTELEFGGVVYPVGTQIKSTYDLQIFRGTYAYNYFTDKRIRLGASIGVFVMPVKFSAETGSAIASATDFTAPLPVLGLDFNFAITPKVYIKQSIEFLYVQFGGIKGSINDINLKVEYNPWKHVGFGLGYNSYQLALRIPKDSNTSLDFVGDIQSGYTGILFYGKLRF